MVRALIAVAIGFASGVASGAFGIGGALLSTPGIRILLQTSALTAVGTTLPVIIPTALTGVIAYVKQGFVDVRLAVVAAIAGAGFAVLGAFSTTLVPGESLMIATAAMIVVLSFRMLTTGEPSTKRQRTASIPLYLAVGAASGFVSGLLGLGGGIILVPVFTGLLRLPIKTALGTSLAVIAAQAIPGTTVHAGLGNVDWTIAAGLTVGVIPGARIGSRLAVKASEHRLRIAVGIAMAAMAVLFGASELQKLLS